jgi:hypothetical protein
MHAIARSKAADQVVAMFVNPANEITGYADGG